MNKVRTVAMSAAFAALCLVAFAGQTVAQSVSNQVFNGMLFARYFMARCDADFRSIYPNLDAESLEAQFRQLVDALTDRAAVLHPEMDRNHISAKLRHTTDRRAMKIKIVLDQDECGPALYSAQGIPFRRFGGPEFVQFIERIRTRYYPYDKRQQLMTADDGVQTYAYRYFQKIALRTIGTTMHKQCHGLKIHAVTVASREPLGDLNVPVFAMPTIRYVERWRASCGRMEETFEVTFDQHSEGGSGRYSIKPVQTGR